MAAIALVARPRYVGIGLVIGVLLALLVVPPPEPRVPEARIEFGSWNLPKPEAGPGEVLVQVEVALTDGTDLKTFRRGHPLLARTSHVNVLNGGVSAEIAAQAPHSAVVDVGIVCRADSKSRR